MTMEAKTNILDNISRCNMFPFIKILKNVCPHRVYKLATYAMGEAENYYKINNFYLV
jgi:hypothetical protein